MNKVWLIVCTILAGQLYAGTESTPMPQITATYSQGWVTTLSFTTNNHEELNLNDNPITIQVPHDTFVAAAWGIEAPLKVTLDTKTVAPDNLIYFNVGKTKEGREITTPDSFEIMFTPNTNRLEIKELMIGDTVVPVTKEVQNKTVFTELAKPTIPKKALSADFYPGFVSCLTVNLGEEINLEEEHLSLLISKNNFIAGAWGIGGELSIKMNEHYDKKHTKITFKKAKDYLGNPLKKRSFILWFSPDDANLIIHDLRVGDKQIPLKIKQPTQKTDTPISPLLLLTEKELKTIPVRFIPFMDIDEHAQQKRKNALIDEEEQGILDIDKTSRDEDRIIKTEIEASIIKEIIQADPKGVYLSCISKDQLKHTMTYGKIGWKADEIYLPLNIEVEDIKKLQDQGVFVALTLGQEEGSSFLGTRGTQVQSQKHYYKRLHNLLTLYKGVGLQLNFDQTIFHDKKVSAQELFKAVTQLQKEGMLDYPVILCFPLKVDKKDKKIFELHLSDEAKQLITEASSSELAFTLNLLVPNLSVPSIPKSFIDHAQEAATETARFLLELYKKGPEDLPWAYKQLQLTPFLGKSGPKKALFTEKDAQDLTAWAQKNGAAISLWSLTRDHPVKIIKKKRQGGQRSVVTVEGPADFTFTKIFKTIDEQP